MPNEYTIHLKIEHLPEGEYLATCDDLPGLVAQGRTISEAVEIAQDVAKKLIESYIEHGDKLPDTLKKITDENEYVLIAKTMEANFEKVKREVEKIHSYTCPCVIRIPVSSNKKYFDWLKSEVK